ncbi:MAG TPA: ABC transporter ATP-binding protein [Stellaceae bacterium]|nr:ABC transporter ATP-binding protein [Stellaceae bacterium]
MTDLSGRFQAKGAEIRLVGLSRAFGEIHAVRNISLVAERGEFLTLLGASGSGKSTTLMMIAGFVTPSEGDILVDGVSILGKPPDKRNLGVVFQSYALFPHMSVAQNIAFPLRMRRRGSTEIKQRTEEALAMVHLSDHADRRIDQLSGGQQQRVALARSLVFRPPVLLMDEPLGALDRKLREQMQLEIKRIQRSLGITVIYVTHDQEEALILSDRIAIMHDGELHQIGTPDAVYERPHTPYVASFLGESNFLEGIHEERHDTLSWLRLSSGERIATTPADLPIGARVQAMIRPESISLSPPHSDETANALAGEVEICEYLGQSIRYFVRNPASTLIVREPRREPGRRATIGENVTLYWSPKSTLVFPA